MTKQCCRTCALWDDKHAYHASGRIRNDITCRCLWRPESITWPASIPVYNQPTMVTYSMRSSDGVDCKCWTPKMPPLSEFALAKLSDIALHPVPRVAVNPGVVNRLEREGLVKEVMLPSPFKTHKGGKCAHLTITDAGRAAIKKGDQP